MIIWVVLGLLLAIISVGRFYLGGADLRAYDAPIEPPLRDSPPPPESAQQSIAAVMAELSSATAGVPFRQRLTALRDCFDAMGDNASFDGDIVRLEHPGLAGEWLVPEHADPGKRLLYLHGGAWMMGSARSHRVITMRLAKIIGGPVLALDYRLLPEHHRRAGIQDCRDAYRWLIDHGPEGPAAAQELYIAGDSAGGNLTLSVINWVRDSGLQPPQAAVALSPATDCTLTSPSLRNNLATDPILGHQFGRLAALPRWTFRWIAWMLQRSRPSDPVISPIYDDLSGLPPVLVQASTTEMLIDDARRYVNKARSCQSPVQLQTWCHMVHVWHLFPQALPESEQAFTEIANFLASASTGERKFS
jgi:monoterpene epsilon-lactone hydrolase